MAKYILLGNFTQQGIQAVKDSPKRRAMARDFGQVGGGRH